MERRTFLKGLVAIPFVPIPRLVRGLESLAPVEPANAYSCLVPHGTILPFAGNMVPPGFLPCDGRAIPAAMYPKLHAAIGDAFGARRRFRFHHFHVPDLRASSRHPAARPVLDRLQRAKNPNPIYDLPTFQWVIRA